jgi:hypothetical protein
MQRFVTALAIVTPLLSACADEAADHAPPDLPPIVLPLAGGSQTGGPEPYADYPVIDVPADRTDRVVRPEKNPERVVRPIGSAGTQPDLPTVSPLAPRPPLYQLGAPSLPPGTGGAAPNFGPVTGYGPGGLAQPPGAPANPPYR